MALAGLSDYGLMEGESSLEGTRPFPIMMERGKPFDLNGRDILSNMEKAMEFASNKRGQGIQAIEFGPAEGRQVKMEPWRGEMVLTSLERKGYAYLNSLTDLNWKIVGTGDFNGDWKVDIL